MKENLTILIIEDDQSMLDGQIDLLEMVWDGRYQVEILTALNGLKGLEILKTHQPDIIVSDIMMPGMDGIEFLRQVRANEHTKNIPFVFVTARAEPANIIEGEAIGVDAYITKPFAINDLLSTLERIIQLGLIKSNIEEYFSGQETKEYVSFLINYIEKEKNLRSKQAKLFSQLSSAYTTEKKLVISNVDNFTAGIMHDLNNALGIIRNTVGFLGDELEEETHKSDLQKINLSLDYLDLIVRNLQSLGNDFIYSPELVNLEEMIQQTYLILKSKLVNISFELVIDPKAKQIWFDEGQFKQLLMNLFKNSSEAMPEGGKLIVSTQALADDKIKIRIRDTGTGITQANQKKLFKENFSTKGTGRGLGLSIVKSIVDANDGSIEVQSQRNKGTTFIITFPIGSG